MTKTLPRGIRNHNPGNIRRGSPWQGLSASQTDPSFCNFDGPEWGIRAIVMLLMTYQRKYGLDTIAKIVTRWAPSIENDTRSYINSVASACGVDPDEPIDLKTSPEILKGVVEAIIRHENGIQPYDDDTILVGIALAEDAHG